MAELTQNEKKLLTALAQKKQAEASALAGILGTTPDAVVQWAHLAQDKGLVKIDKLTDRKYTYTDEGKGYLEAKLPETQIFQVLGENTKFSDLQKYKVFKIGFGQLRKKGLVIVRDGIVIKVSGASTDNDEAAFKNPGSSDPVKVKEFIKRGLIEESESVLYMIDITSAGLDLAAQGLDLREETGTLTRDQIISGEWKNLNLRRYDVTKLPRKTYPGKIHPYQRLIEIGRAHV